MSILGHVLSAGLACVLLGPFKHHHMFFLTNFQWGWLMLGSYTTIKRKDVLNVMLI